MTATLYWFELSHPAQAVRVMLRRKGIEHGEVKVLPGFQPLLRVAGFPGITVPALRLDGRRLQGSRQIAAALEELVPEPPLFPADPAARARVLEAERWGDEVFQAVPRRMFRWALTGDRSLRRWLAESSGVPGPGLAAALGAPSARWFARRVRADEATVRADLRELPAMLDRVDGLLADGVLDVEEPNAATLQVLSTVRSLDSFSDVHPLVDAHACAAPARALFADFPGPVPPFLPAGWVPPSG